MDGALRLPFLFVGMQVVQAGANWGRGERLKMDFSFGSVLGLFSTIELIH